MAHYVKERAKKEKESVVRVLLLVVSFWASYVDHVDDDCQADDDSGENMRIVVFQTDAARAEEHIQWDEELE